MEDRKREGTSDDAPVAADHHRGLRRRRQEHTDRPAAARHRQPAARPSGSGHRRGGIADLAALSDGLRAEREQGITIDVAYRFFSTEARSYILADTPGHERYTRNMFTGASNAHVAVLLVDARAGVLRQTNRHARIAKLLGIKHFVATVNKFDLVDFDEADSRGGAQTARWLPARRIDVTVIPIAAKHGDNVVHRSDADPWYEGPPARVSGSVELSAPQPEPSKLAAARAMGVETVGRTAPPLYRPAVGGHLRVGDPVSQPARGHPSTVTVVDTLDDDRTTAVAPLSVSIELADDIDVGRGDVFVSGRDDAVASGAGEELDATVCWFVDSPLRAGDRLALKQGTRTVRATVQALHRGSIPRRSTSWTTRSSWCSTTSAR
jgi:bifunctional enzyme CysN/CysC